MKLPPHLDWLGEALLAILVTGLGAALIVGLLLLLAPRVLVAVNTRLSRWIDTRRTFSLLERPLVLERFFYRHHQPLGLLIVAGASYVLLRWWFAFDRAAFIGVIDRWWRSSGMDFLVPAAEWIVVGLHLLILAAGLVILLRPSLLKDVERQANQWRRVPSTERLDAVIGEVDTGIVGHPRLAGLVITLASAWSLAMLVPPFIHLLGR